MPSLKKICNPRAEVAASSVDRVNWEPSDLEEC